MLRRGTATGTDAGPWALLRPAMLLAALLAGYWAFETGFPAGTGADAGSEVAPTRLLRWCVLGVAALILLVLTGSWLRERRGSPHGGRS